MIDLQFLDNLPPFAKTAVLKILMRGPKTKAKSLTTKYCLDKKYKKTFLIPAKRPAVTHVPTFQSARKMMSQWCFVS